MTTDTFDGQIMGVGTTSGTRLVVGDWFTSPLGRFTDVMVAHPDGRRELLAPNREVADYVTSTYHFDDVRVCPIEARGGHATHEAHKAHVSHEAPGARPSDGAASGRAGAPRSSRAPRSSMVVEAGPLRLTATLGSRHPWGHLLARVPHALHGPLFARIVNPGARLVMPGVRTYGSAKGGRTEAYVAQDLHRVTALVASWDGASLGALTAVDPPPTFGFSSSPTLPSLTRVTTFVQH